ncbi:MAG TPA: peptidoglycan-binding protein [Gaiellaceae bacterium]|nr:peptidoglycan-binding protein [Gaiellaceae bacterium]
MLARERALKIALAEARAGVKEKGTDTGKRVRQYQGADSYRPRPDTNYFWCASFIVWCYREARRVLEETGRSASVPETEKAARRHGWVKKRPKPGDIVCVQFAFNGLPPVDMTPDHIAIVVDVLGDGSVRTVEGNTNGESGGQGVFVKTRPASECETFIRVPGMVPSGLGRGDEGPDVKRLQRQLRRLGHKSVEPDGEFGEKTEAAVERFQKRHDLPETGVATKATQAAIVAELEAREEPPEAAAPARRFRVTATFADGDSEQTEQLPSRPAMHRKVNAFLTDGATSIEVKPLA